MVLRYIKNNKKIIIVWVSCFRQRNYGKNIFFGFRIPDVSDEQTPEWIFRWMPKKRGPFGNNDNTDMSLEIITGAKSLFPENVFLTIRKVYVQVMFFSRKSFHIKFVKCIRRHLKWYFRSKLFAKSASYKSFDAACNLCGVFCHPPTHPLLPTGRCLLCCVRFVPPEARERSLPPNFGC